MLPGMKSKKKQNVSFIFFFFEDNHHSTMSLLERCLIFPTTEGFRGKTNVVIKSGSGKKQEG